MGISIAGTCLQPNVWRALLQTFRTLDWAAINRMLDAPRLSIAEHPAR